MTDIQPELQNAVKRSMKTQVKKFVNPQSLSQRGTLYNFVDFYIQKAPKAVSSVGYIPLPDEGYQINSVHFYKGKVGTVFDGKSEMNLTIGELLRKEAQF